MEKLEVLQKSTLFEMLSQSELELLAELSRPRRYAAGEVIFEEGDLGDSLFVLMNGEVDVLHKDGKGEAKVLATLQPPEFFGEMSLIDKEFRSATVRARKDATMLHLTAENLATFRKNYKDGFAFLVINIARVLSNRLRETNGRLRQQA
ncbi:MAG TPA: cyclic nucleotide-binding domain-containing protein [Myxococcales bacterium]|nr:cyclic nucleotide-binding domain-containing protein [Myxococcales bacterium]